MSMKSAHRRRPRSSPRPPEHHSSAETIAERVRRLSGRLTKGQQRVVEFLLADCDRGVFLLSAQVAEELNLSEATVVRAARALGFDGYPAFRSALRAYVADRKSSVIATSARVASPQWTPTIRSISEVLADFIVDAGAGELATELVERAKTHIIDTLAVGLVGARAPSSQAIYRAVAAGSPRPEATIFGQGRIASAPDAALANGASAHALELDDDHRLATLHPGAVVVPAALAAAESTNAPGATLVRSVVFGYEVMCRVGEAFLGSQYQRGFHPTGTCGVFGAAIAASIALNLDRDGLVRALGIAGTQASGLAEWRTGGSWIKRLHPGRAAQSGVLAARLAAEGFTGPASIFEGPGGFLQAFAADGAVDLEALTRKLGNEYRFLATAVKAYPCCRPAHAAIDLALDAVRDGVTANAVESVRISIPKTNVLTYVRRPATTVEAQFSLPYLFAAALVRGRLGLAELTDETLRDPQILALAERIAVKEKPEFTAQYPARSPVEVIITLPRKRQVRKFSDCPRGEPDAAEYRQRPDLFHRVVEQKARALLAEAGLANRAAALIRTVRGLPDAPNLRSLTALLV